MTTTMMERTLALATAMLLSTTAVSGSHTPTEDSMPSTRIIRNSDLFDIMLSQSKHTATPEHRHLQSMPTEEKSTTVKKNWMEISPDTQFLPNILLDESTLRRLGGYSSSNPYSTEPFVDGMGEYDEEAQSWRKLGFIIDCQSNDEDMYSEHSQHSGDNNDATMSETGCARYLIWAAYVNENYQGNGAAEYQYYDPYYKQWDQTACSYANGSPCTKMDCHLSSTSFSLLGFFKHRKYDDWMEQLFKHQGICRWNDEDYAFMKNARKAWPQGCTLSSAKTKNGKPLYYDLKPAYSGEITVSMYIDATCDSSSEYYMSTSAIENILGNILGNGQASQHSNDNGGDYDFSGESLASSLNRWNSAFDIWSICHSCVAHDLDNPDGSVYYGTCYDDGFYNNDDNTDDKAAYYNAYNNYYGNGNNDDANRQLRQLGGDYCPRGYAFECYDDAGYTSVNQCMKFSAKTVMRTASFRDLAIANLQGTLTSHSLSGYVDQTYEFHSHTKTNALTYTFLVSMCMLCVASLVYLVKIIQEASRSRNAPALTETLV